jgi:hypothetical protein
MIDQDPLRNRVPMQKRLRHRINLVVMSAVGESKDSSMKSFTQGANSG